MVMPTRTFGAGGLVAAATIALLVGCGSPSTDEVLRDRVLTCIVDGGGQVDDDADVAIVDGQAMAVVGPVSASEDLISDCLGPTKP
jgi:hypothetical protein